MFIEFWGMNDAAYMLGKRRKQAVYRREKLAVVELEPDHLKNLDTHLPAALRKHGVVVA